MIRLLPARLAGAALSVALLAGCSVPSDGTTSGASPSASPSSKYNALDAAAITGAFAVARQIPDKGKGNIAKLQSALAAQKGKAYVVKDTLDLGVVGNTLLDYQLTSEGASGPICVVVRAPNVGDEVKPGQPQWVLYVAPKGASTIVLLRQGVTSCSEAASIAGKIAEKDADTVSGVSRGIGRDSVLRVPATALSPVGLILLDEARGMAPNPAAKR